MKHWGFGSPRITIAGNHLSRIMMSIGSYGSWTFKKKQVGRSYFPLYFAGSASYQICWSSSSTIFPSLCVFIHIFTLLTFNMDTKHHHMFVAFIPICYFWYVKFPVPIYHTIHQPPGIYNGYYLLISTYTVRKPNHIYPQSPSALSKWLQEPSSDWYPYLQILPTTDPLRLV